MAYLEQEHINIVPFLNIIREQMGKVKKEELKEYERKYL